MQEKERKEWEVNGKEKKKKKNVQKEIQAIKGWQLIQNLSRSCISALSRQEKPFPDSFPACIPVNILSWRRCLRLIQFHTFLSSSTALEAALGRNRCPQICRCFPSFIANCDLNAQFYHGFVLIPCIDTDNTCGDL